MDCISSLPDEVLSHILSFLPTKHAASTSVLAKRWRNLFAFVPNLEFDDSVFLHPEEGKRGRDGILQSFMDFVDRALDFRGGSSIKKFSLKCKTGVDPDHVDQWIQNVLRRGVLDIDLLLNSEDIYWLTSEILMSGTLVGLKLRSTVFISGWDVSISLPMLKTLLLVDTPYLRLQMLFSACPSLEELYMSNLTLMRDKTLSSASLKTLTMIFNGFLCTHSFVTPSLVYLKYSDHIAKDYPEVYLESLFEARINLLLAFSQIKLLRAHNTDWLEDDEDYEESEDDEDDEVDLSVRFDNVLKLIDGIRNVQKLYLSPNTLEVLSRCCEAMPVFKNLKLLGIESAMNRGWQAVPVLLRNCPRLEALLIAGLLHYVTDKCGDACDCISHEEKGRSLMSCPVKSLQIQGFRGTMREVDMIMHFLDYFPCLNEMQIFAEEKGTDFKVPKQFEAPTVFDLSWRC